MKFINVRAELRVMFLINIFMILIVSFYGCNKKNAQEGEKIKIEYLVPGTADSHQREEEIVKSFNETHPDIAVDMKPVPWSGYSELMAARLAGNTPPDIWFIDGTTIFNYVDKRVVKELTDWVYRDLIKSEYLGIEGVTDTDGKIWGIPHSLQVQALFYNKVLFDATGVGYPDETWSWDTLWDAALKLTKDLDEDGRKDQFGFGGYGLEQNLIYQMGITILDQEKRHSLLYRSEAIEAIKFGHQLKATMPTRSAQESFGGEVVLFSQNRLAMWQTTYYFISEFNKNPSLKYDVALAFKGKVRKWYYVSNCLLISSKSTIEKQMAAWEFLKYLSSYNIQKLRGASGEGLPYLRKAFLELVNQPNKRLKNLKVFFDILDYSIPMDLSPVFQEWYYDKFYKNMELWIMGQLTPEEAVLKAHKEIQKVLDEYYEKEK